MNVYEYAKERYAALGIDTEAALTALRAVPVSLHCWQGDDVRGFDGDPSKPLTGGIQTTGSYPGRARTVSPVERAVSSFKYVSWQPPPRMFRLVHVLPVRADSSRTASR